MKTIGLLGGTAWVSTIDYYRTLNQKVNKKLGKHHCAKIELHSIDYQEIKQYNYEQWEPIQKILARELQVLDSFGVDCILICNNTLHKAYNAIADSLELQAVVIHIIDAVGEHAKHAGLNKLLLVGTQFTMEDGFYQEKLSDKYGLEVITPNAQDRKDIQRITQEELSKEIINSNSRQWLHKTIQKYPTEGVIVGCTELPLLIDAKDYAVPILNTLEIQCEAAIAFSFGE